MENAAFANWMKSLDADPRFYDRCLTVCTVLLVLMLAAVVFVALQAPPRITSAGTINLSGGVAAAESGPSAS